MAYSTSLGCITIETLFFFGVIIVDAVIYYYTFLCVGGIKPFHRGFFCNDPDIMKPYETERLSFVGVLTAGTVLSLIAIAAVEFELYFQNRRDGETNGNQEKKMGRARIPSGVTRMLHRMGIFGAGLNVVLLICLVLTIMLGRLRPHFLAVCKPNKTLYNCSDGYITADVCTGDPLHVKRARLSFPSTHTALSVYSLVFVAICLQNLRCLQNSKILRLTLQGILVTLAIATGLSKINSYYHHWTDVIGGVILGTVSARIVTIHVMKLSTNSWNSNPVYAAVPEEDHEGRHKENEKIPLVK